MDERGGADPGRDGAGFDGSTRRAAGNGHAAAAARAVIPLAMANRSPFLTTCPFFRTADPDRGPGPPVEAPDPANRCGAFGELTAQSARQQELVCLTRAHADCPRYLRGALLLHDGADAAPAQPQPTRTMSRATVAALVLLAVSAGASFAFVVARGGLVVPGPAGSQAAAAVTGTPAVGPTSAATVRPAAIATPTPKPTPSTKPAPSPSPTPSPTPTATPEPTPAPTARPTPRPTSVRYALLRPCTGSPNCWVYTVRSGDNLYSIANYFGHSLETVYRLNPWARTTPLRAGQELVLPPPTR